jgi:hypothetical protein
VLGHEQLLSEVHNNACAHGQPFRVVVSMISINLFMEIAVFTVTSKIESNYGVNLDFHVGFTV